MADRYTEVTRTSFFSNLMGSFIGVLFGVLLFIGSFFVLWINEGRLNLATVARKSTPIAAASIAPDMEGKLVAATGTLSTPEQLDDAGFIRPGNYLALERSVEMYAWVEHTSSSTTKNTGGSSTTETTYRYEREWTSDPESASSFRYPDGHENPALPLQSQSWTVPNATLDAYTVDPQQLTLPEAQPIKLDDETTEISEPWRVDGEYLTDSTSSVSQPRLGDVRIRYLAVPDQIDVTLFGKASGSQIVPFETKGEQLYRAFSENREQAISTLNTEYQISIWIIRVIGFVMMWLGLSLCFSPINAVLDILPFLGNMSRFLTGALMFGIALVLSMLTILASIIAHNIFLLIGLLIVIIGCALLWSRVRRPSMAAVST